MAIELPGRVMQLVRAISRYLRINPLACDTSDGIARWWVGAEQVIESDVEAALGWMQKNGIIETSLAADGRVRYRRALDADIDAALDRLLRCDAQEKDGRHGTGNG